MNRSKFRSGEMEDFEKYANDPRWGESWSKNQYIYPLRIKSATAKREGFRLAVGNPPDETYQRGQFVCATSPQSHKSRDRWAIDFLVPDGTPVLAAREGEVVGIQEQSESWGDGPEYRDLLNYLTIQHDNGEFSHYCHLAKNSVSQCSVQIGSQVKQGQQVAVVGKTGWTDRDHLHFVVYENMSFPIGPFWIRSLQPRFKSRWRFW